MADWESGTDWAKLLGTPAPPPPNSFVSINCPPGTTKGRGVGGQHTFVARYHCICPAGTKATRVGSEWRCVPEPTLPNVVAAIQEMMKESYKPVTPPANSFPAGTRLECPPGTVAQEKMPFGGCYPPEGAKGCPGSPFLNRTWGCDKGKWVPLPCPDGAKAESIVNNMGIKSHHCVCPPGTTAGDGRCASATAGGQQQRCGRGTARCQSITLPHDHPASVAFRRKRKLTRIAIGGGILVAGVAIVAALAPR